MHSNGLKMVVAHSLPVILRLQTPYIYMANTDNSRDIYWIYIVQTNISVCIGATSIIGCHGRNYDLSYT